jgi:soluble lytic murein transglycosylase-like protein
MTVENITPLRMNRAPLLAATAMICLIFNTSTINNSINTTKALRSGILTTLPAYEKGEVLVQDDAGLYRSIFALQEKGDWKEADKLIAQLSDKRLMGHVMADRYQRRPATLEELQGWLTIYRDLPEADDLYEQAQKLPGSKNVKLPHPTTASAIISGSGYAYTPGSGFRSKAHMEIKGASVNTKRTLDRIDRVLRAGDPATAKMLLETVLQQNQLPHAALVSLQSRLAAGFYFNGNAEEARRLTETAYMQNDARALWINGLSNFSTGHRPAAALSFVALANRDDLSNSDHAAAAFWAYRAMDQAGAKKTAAKWLAEAASEPTTFYGLLAITLSGRNIEDAWTWHLPELNSRATTILAEVPAGARALALVQIDQNNLAESELRHLNPQSQRPLQEAMLALAEKGHMASLALKLGNTVVSGDGKPYDAALYPVPPWQPTDGFQVDRALIYALIRHESKFDPEAVSSQGACGLMQLMPATAERMAGIEPEDAERAGKCADKFFDPVTNVGLGQRYVRKLSDQRIIGDNLMLLLTAYNGGPGRLSQRPNLDAKADPLLFMEALPAQETHDYVQQVMMQYWGYQARLHQPLTSLTQLAHGQWPRFVTHDTPPTREVFAIPTIRKSFALASNIQQ